MLPAGPVVSRALPPSDSNTMRVRSGGFMVSKKGEDRFRTLAATLAGGDQLSLALVTDGHMGVGAAEHVSEHLLQVSSSSASFSASRFLLSLLSLLLSLLLLSSHSSFLFFLSSLMLLLSLLLLSTPLFCSCISSSPTPRSTAACPPWTPRCARAWRPSTPPSSPPAMRAAARL